MSSLLHTSYPVQYSGATRAASAVAAVRGIRGRFDSTRGLSAMLLAAMVSALVVVSEQLIDTWADGHLMLAWIALWLIVFSVLALFASSARKLAITAVKVLDAWSLRVAQDRSDAQLWAIAQRDPRVMADLRAALARNER